MGTKRRQLARDIHKAGTTDPESLAEYLIQRGWTNLTTHPTMLISTPYSSIKIDPLPVSGFERTMDRYGR